MDAAEFFIQVILLNGQITMSDVIQRVISRLKEDLNGGHAETPKFGHPIFHK